MSKIRLGTIWLDACSGCHMSFLDMDEALLPVADRVEVVFSPLVDAKTIPEQVDVFLISGSVSTEEDVETVRKIRESAAVVVSLGDCAVTGNVPSMRNRYSAAEVLDAVYRESDPEGDIPSQEVPKLLDHALPVHHIVEVDAFIQGCPPHPDLIKFILNELLEGRVPGRGVRTTFG